MGRFEHMTLHLEVLDVREPCTEDWSRMRGDERKRFCDRCQQSVFDLSAMTRNEAEALVTAAEGRVCVRFYRRADGTVTTLDCAPRRLEALRRGARRSLGLAAVGVAAVMAVVGALGVAAARSSAEDVRRWAIERLDPEPVIVMGEPAIEMPVVEAPAPVE